MAEEKYIKKSIEEKKKEIENLIKNLEKRINKYFDTPENIKEYLLFMSKFHNYSLSNTILIESQFPGARAVGSFSFWKENGFNINKSEKGIKIIVPKVTKDKFLNKNNEWISIDKATDEEKKQIAKGKLESRRGNVYFSQGYVFDVLQTNATLEDLPKIFPDRWIDGDVRNYDLMYKGMEKIAEKIGVKIVKPKHELGAAKGASYPTLKEVALNPRNTQLQNVKTLLHELTHAKLHSDKNRDNYSVNEKEFQAELTAYTICSYLGIDTSEYSIRYLNSWTKNATLNDKKSLLKEVHQTSIDYINILEEVLNKELSLSNNDKESSLNLNNKDLKNLNVKGDLEVSNLKKDEKEIRKMIAEHEEWLNTKGTKGKRLNLENENLKGMKLLNLDLRNSNFKNADLRDCIIYANLEGANLQGIKLNNKTKFIGSNLKNVIMTPKTLALIDHQIKFEENKHKSGLKSLKTSKIKQKDISK